MEKTFLLSKINEDLAELLDEESKKKFLWPQSALPSGSKVGDKINFLISLDSVEVAKKKQFAKDILNEVLDIENS